MGRATAVGSASRPCFAPSSGPARVWASAPLLRRGSLAPRSRTRSSRQAARATSPRRREEPSRTTPSACESAQWAGPAARSATWSGPSARGRHGPSDRPTEAEPRRGRRGRPGRCTSTPCSASRTGSSRSRTGSSPGCRRWRSRRCRLSSRALSPVSSVVKFSGPGNSHDDVRPAVPPSPSQPSRLWPTWGAAARSEPGPSRTLSAYVCRRCRDGAGQLRLHVRSGDVRP